MFTSPVKIFRLACIVVAFSTLSAMEEKTIESEKAANTTTIPDLPNDVLGIIFKEFTNLEGIETLKRLRLVCHRYNRCVTNHFDKALNSIAQQLQGAKALCSRECAASTGEECRCHGGKSERIQEMYYLLALIQLGIYPAAVHIKADVKNNLNLQRGMVYLYEHFIATHYEPNNFEPNLVGQHVGFNKKNKVVKMLLVAGLDPNWQLFGGDIPLWIYAAGECRMRHEKTGEFKPAIFMELLKYGADINIEFTDNDSKKFTPLDSLCREEDSSNKQFFIDFYTSLGAQRSQHATSL